MKKIAIMYGGPGKEHEVSVNSAKNILENINREKFKVIEIFADKDLNFFVKNIENLDLDNKNYSEAEIFVYIKENKIEKIFPVFHGQYGEGGNLQKKFEENYIDFVGSGSLASYNAMDKNLSNAIFLENNILIPKTKIIDMNSFLDTENFLRDFNFPVIVKPVNEGSSVDLFKFENKEDLVNSLENIFKNYKEMMMQECIEGREFTCGVIELKDKENNSVKKALKPTEIILTKTKTFNYEAKYTNGGCEEITPANISENLMDSIQSLAIKCHQILNCKDISRTDIILDKKGDLYVLETNTIPGMTKTSFLPAQLKADNISMKETISILLN